MFSEPIGNENIMYMVEIFEICLKLCADYLVDASLLCNFGITKSNQEASNLRPTNED